MSGLAEPEREAQAQAAGMRVFLPKPFTIDQLAFALNEALADDSPV
jgi:CheY-like chemotaxis protein